MAAPRPGQRPVGGDAQAKPALSYTQARHAGESYKQRELPEPVAAQGVVPQFKNSVAPRPRAAPDSCAENGIPTSQMETALQAPVKGWKGFNVPAKQQVCDAPHRPPAGDPNLPSVGDLPPDIFRFNDHHGEGFGLPFLLHDDDPTDIDVDMDLNYDSKDPSRADIRYSGGMNFQGALCRRIGDKLAVTTRPQAPNTILTLGQTTGSRGLGNGAVLGAGRVPTSPLPLCGPRFSADTDPLPPFGAEAWSLDLLPASSFDEIAGSTVPTAAIGMVDTKADSEDPKYCEEILENLSKCDKVAVAQCVDRYGASGVASFTFHSPSPHTRVLEVFSHSAALLLLLFLPELF